MESRSEELRHLACFCAGSVTGLAMAFLFIFSLPLDGGMIRIGWLETNIPFILAYFLAIVAVWAFEYGYSGSFDTTDIFITTLGVLYVHVSSFLGLLIGDDTGNGIVTSSWGWTVFVVEAAVVAVICVCLFIKSRKGNDDIDIRGMR